MAGTLAPAHAGPYAEARQQPLGECIVGHLHDTRLQGMETLLHGRPCRCHHTDNGDCSLVKVIKAAPVFHQQLGGDVGVVVGIPAKEDCIRRLPD